MSWYIDASLNEGYPTNTDFIPAHVGWTDTNSIPLPELAWRIRADANEGYPFIGYFFTSHSGQQGGEMDIGGSQTNYPNGFTYANRGALVNGLSPTGMSANDGLVSAVNNAYRQANRGKILALGAGEMSILVGFLHDPGNFSDTAKMEMVYKLFGASVFDSIITCRMYPMALPDDPNYTYPLTLYGLFPVNAGGDSDPMQVDGCYELVKRYGMGYVDPPMEQAWEIERPDFMIYLPYSGIHTIDLRSTERLWLYLTIDFMTGQSVYELYQGTSTNMDIIGVWPAQVGWDFPINSIEKQLSSNLFNGSIDLVSNALGAIGGALGSAMGGPIGGAISAGTKTVQGIASTISNGKHCNLTAVAPGGLCSSYDYPYPRIIIKIPKMFNEGDGFPEIIGLNRSSAYMRLDTCSGFTRCENYKCDVITATTEEKREIESLMNAGVFL